MARPIVAGIVGVEGEDADWEARKMKSAARRKISWRKGVGGR